ncbi:MAG: endonuclease VII domain-containing protein [Nitrospiraceae bacterium]
MACRNCPGKSEWKGNTGLCQECAARQGSRLYDEQAGKCAICGMPLDPRTAEGCVPKKAHLDHDHHTGQIRGVLCPRCNLGIGHFDENPSRLRTAAVYLEKWRQMASEQ